MDEKFWCVRMEERRIDKRERERREERRMDKRERERERMEEG